MFLALDKCLSDPEDWKLLERIQEQIEQIVCIDCHAPGLSSVAFDRQAAALQVTEYLLKQGYEDIIYIGQSDQRIAGFKQAFIERGLDISGPGCRNDYKPYSKTERKGLNSVIAHKSNYS